ncbi:MAG: lytic transglycosylase domain-containing protein [Magnetococcales bacterium]|nr:lytic transglycosylase domain-containing protein [Magnetococcales bacterium]MBF0321702.1 lytic transglycosylase domain-containing protein [Magnetococcales bacterium]
MLPTRSFSRLYLLLFVVCAFVLVDLVTAHPTRADNDDNNNGVEAYRRLFDVLDADVPITSEVLDRSRWPSNDLLASYLELELLQHPRMMRPLTSDLRHFTRRWPNHPHVGKVLNMLDERIVLEGTTADILAWFDRRPPRTADQQKNYLEALLANRRIEDAWRIWRDYYRNGYDIPPALEQVTQTISRQLTRDDHETRARALIEKGKGNALPEVLYALHDPALQNYFLTLAAAKNGDKQFDAMVAQLPTQMAQSSEIWFERLENLRRRGHHSQAISMLQGPWGGYLNAEDGSRVRYRLAKDLVYPKKDYRNAWLVLQPSLKLKEGKLSDTFWLAGWCAYKLGDKSAAVEVFQRLGEEGDDLRLRSQGAIWAAVFLGIDKPEATRWLELAGRYPETFYGFLGAEMSHPGTLAELTQSKTECSPSLLERQDLQPGLARMAILKSIGRSYHNGLEVQALADPFGLSPQEQICLATTYGDPNHAIRVATPLYHKQGIRNWTGLFPIPPWRPATGWILDPALVWGTGRQESLFSPTVVSRSGALGLLQLMPPTAREEAGKLKMEASTPLRLREPGYNLALGQSYLYRMLKRFDGDVVMALIAYNAGPTRAENLRTDRRLKDTLNFIEDIPIQETRDYVKKVTHGLAVYRQIQYGDGSVMGVISPGQPGMQNLAPPHALMSQNRMP